MYVRYNIYTNTCSGVSFMENPIVQSQPMSLVSKVKDTFYNHSGFEIFDVKPQMPKKQISHFAKKIVQSNRLVAIQINEGQGVVTEIIGYPTFSENSCHLIIQSLDKKIAHLVTGSTIRHIRHI